MSTRTTTFDRDAREACAQEGLALSRCAELPNVLDPITRKAPPKPRRLLLSTLLHSCALVYLCACIAVLGFFMMQRKGVGPASTSATASQVSP